MLPDITMTVFEVGFPQVLYLFPVPCSLSQKIKFILHDYLALEKNWAKFPIFYFLCYTAFLGNRADMAELVYAHA